MDTKNKIERRDDQLTPFTFGDHAVRTALVNGEPWFVAKDVCDVLGLGNPSQTMSNFPKEDRGIISSDTSNGKQYRITVNEPGLYRLIFRSRKREADKFKNWVFTEVLPQIRRTGAYTPGKVEAANVYSLFSACPEMTIQRVNKLAYYLAMRPPLANADIAKLLDVSDATVTYWRKRLSVDTARAAVETLGINALGHTANVPPRVPQIKLPPLAAPGTPELPAKEAGNEPNE
ncbi:MAG: Bro-N domain-containing protein [Spirochaetaceae bacterium]|jgi:prophage antirepressor-like protein|nr:Bro-N domain-containing protein [Spirochaetaceae bacterium]